MARVREFRGVRYDAGRVDPRRVLAPPYDVVSEPERAAFAQEPWNVVHLELPLDEEGEGSRYRVAARRLGEWLASGLLRRDSEPMLYAYAQRFEHEGRRRERRGIFGLVELATPGEAGRVFPHERTLSGPREDRLELLRATRANSSPVFLLYEDASGFVREALEGALADGRLGEADTPWGTEETLAAFGGRMAGEAAARLAETALVFADGHHRYESALRYHEEAADAPAGAGPPGDQAHGYVLAALVERTDPGLVVLATHRIVNGRVARDGAWQRTLERCFTTQRFPLDSGSARARALGWLSEQPQRGEGPAFVCALAGESHLLGLALRPDRRGALFESHPEVPSSLRSLDVVALHVLLELGLGITPRAVAEEGALAYTHDAGEALDAVAKGAGAAFVMNPTPVDRVVRLATEGQRLPQKSTYFHPKLTSGWLLHVHDRPEVIWGRAGAGATLPQAQPISKERE